MNFKIGDKVEYVGDDWGTVNPLTIKEILEKSNNYYLLDSNGEDWYLRDVDLIPFDDCATPKDTIRTFDSGATRDTAEGKFEYIGFNCPLVDERFAQYMHKHRKQSDGNLRPSNNWKKGIPLGSYQQSSGRHWEDIRKHWDGYEGRDTLENSICAMLFNLKGYLHEILKAKKILEANVAKNNPCPSAIDQIENITAGSEPKEIEDERG